MSITGHPSTFFSSLDAETNESDTLVKIRRVKPPFEIKRELEASSSTSATAGEPSTRILHHAGGNLSTHPNARSKSGSGDFNMKDKTEVARMISTFNVPENYVLVDGDSSLELVAGDLVA